MLQGFYLLQATVLDKLNQQEVTRPLATNELAFNDINNRSYALIDVKVRPLLFWPFLSYIYLEFAQQCSGKSHFIFYFI